MTTPTGEQLAQLGQAVALANTDDNPKARRDLLDTFENCIEISRRTGWQFTAENVREDLESTTDAWLDMGHHNALSALFGQASKTGRIHSVGRTRSTRPLRHGNRIDIWTARKDTRHARTA